jgi:hypothetical protein
MASPLFLGFGRPEHTRAVTTISSPAAHDACPPASTHALPAHLLSASCRAVSCAGDAKPSPNEHSTKAHVSSLANTSRSYLARVFGEEDVFPVHGEIADEQRLYASQPGLTCPSVISTNLKAGYQVIEAAHGAQS